MGWDQVPGKKPFEMAVAVNEFSIHKSRYEMMIVGNRYVLKDVFFIRIIRNYTDGVLKSLAIFELEIIFLIRVKYIIALVLLDANQWNNQNDIIINLKLLWNW